MSDLFGEAATGNWQIRSHLGYRQSREFYPSSRTWGRWRFYVSGFNDDWCSVMRDDGGFDRDVPIDSQNRILIAGRWFGSLEWDH